MNSENPYNNSTPQFEDRKEMWDSIKITPIKVDQPNLKIYLKELQKFYSNGKVTHNVFEIGESHVLDWYLSRHQLKELFFFDKIWQIPVISKAFKINNAIENAYRKFEWCSSFLFGGLLAHTLNNGGAYESPSWSTAKSKELGELAANDIINNNYNDIMFFESNVPWCTYFFDVDWDYTWVTISKSSRQMNIILATDTD